MTLNRATFYLVGLSFILTGACVYVDVKMPIRPHHYTEAHQRPSDDGKPYLSMSELGANQAARLASKTGALQMCNHQGAKSVQTPDPRHQQTSAWCGAATTRIVMEHYNVSRRKATDDQCIIISKVLGIDTTRHNCCQTYYGLPEDIIIPSSNDIATCVTGIWPHEAFRLYGFDYKEIKQALDWERLTEEICLDSPFISVTKAPDQPNGHTVIVKGYSYVKPAASSSPTDEPRWVEIYDPTVTEFEFVSYSEFVGDPPNTNGPYGYYHVVDYAGIAPLE